MKEALAKEQQIVMQGEPKGSGYYSRSAGTSTTNYRTGASFKRRPMLTQYTNKRAEGFETAETKGYKA